MGFTPIRRVADGAAGDVVGADDVSAQAAFWPQLLGFRDRLATTEIVERATQAFLLAYGTRA